MDFDNDQVSHPKFIFSRAVIVVHAARTCQPALIAYSYELWLFAIAQ